MTRLLRSTFTLSLALLLALPSSARADLVHLNTGGVVKGEIVSETPEEVRIRTPSGSVTTIFREDIERIERNKSADSVYKEKLAKLGPKDADGLYQLGKEMKRLRLEKEAKECFEKALKIDPNHLPAKIELAEGAARANELAAIAAEVDRGGGGERESASAAAPIALPRGKIAPALVKAYEEARKGLRDLDPKRQEEGFAKALALYEDPCASEVHAALVSQIVDLGRRERQAFERTAKKLAGAIPDYEKPEQRKARERYLAAWVKAKDEALEVIFDLKIYPDENHGKVGQPKVDEKVDVVKKVYPTYEALLLGDIAKFRALSEEQAAKVCLSLERGRASVARVAETLSRCLEVEHCATDEQAPALPAFEAPEPAAEPPPAQRALLLYRAGRIEEAYSLSERLTPWEMRLLERMRDLRVEDWNDRILKDPTPLEKGKGKRPNGEEEKQVEITNRYRVMMGRHALEIHPCLVESARGHSEEMTRLNYFEHESPVPENRTPSDRAKNAGYAGGAAENISLGSVSPQATHDAWYNSSGHHRNILGREHLAMGSGLDGQHWTQNFGGQGELFR